MDAAVLNPIFCVIWFITNTSSVSKSSSNLSTNILPLIPKLPVNSCVLLIVSPNLLLPDEKITEDDIRFTFISSTIILPSTIKSSLNLTEPVVKSTIEEPLTKSDTKLELKEFNPLGCLPIYAINYILYEISKTETITSADVSTDDTTDIKSPSSNTTFCSPPTITSELPSTIKPFLIKCLV